MRATGDGGRRSCDREPESREKRAAGEQGAIAQADAQPVTKHTAADHGRGEEGRPETGEDR